jgi:hypothetical protein
MTSDLQSQSANRFSTAAKRTRLHLPDGGEWEYEREHQMLDKRQELHIHSTHY